MSANTVLIKDGAGNLLNFATDYNANTLVTTPTHNLALTGTLISQGQQNKANSVPVTLPADPDYRPSAGVINAADIGTTSTTGQNGVNVITGTPTANSSVSWALNGQSAATLTVSGAFTATLPIECSADGGSTYIGSTAKVLGTGVTVGTVTANGSFRVDVTGMTNIRMRASAYSSGNVNVTLVASAAPGLSQIINPAPIRGADGATSVSNTNPLPVTIQTSNTTLAVQAQLQVANAFVSNTNQIPIVRRTDVASGVTAIQNTYTTNATTSSFTQTLPGRDFNVSAWTSNTFAGTVTMKKSFDGSNWLPITAAGTQLYTWSSVPFAESMSESEYGVQYQLVVTVTSGTVTVRISQ